VVVVVVMMIRKGVIYDPVKQGGLFINVSWRKKKISNKKISNSAVGLFKLTWPRKGMEMRRPKNP
jgi:hypothetical protein